MNYNLNKQGNKNCKGNEGMIRKNIKDMKKNEIEYLKNIMKNLNDLTITNHALEKNLIPANEIQEIIRTKNYKIIDYNYNMITKEERIMFRTKNEYEIKNNEGIGEKCYCKIVISLTNNCIVTIWANRVADEKMKQNNLKNRYMTNFDIINKKVKF